MIVNLPALITISCPACSTESTLQADLLEGCSELQCQFCSTRHATYYWLPPRIRARVYARIRSRMFHEAYRSIHASDSAIRQQ